MLNYPLQFTFKISTLANDFVAKDANGTTVAYARQKMLKLKEHVTIYTDESKSKEMFHIKADKWLDFNTVYNFLSPDGSVSLGKVGRKGWRSIWKAHYEIFDENGNQDFIIQEENPWAKMAEVLILELPLIGLLAAYFINPKYALKRPDGTIVARLTKKRSVFGRHFTLDKLSDFQEGEEMRCLLGFMMMILLERRRG